MEQKESSSESKDLREKEKDEVDFELGATSPSTTTILKCFFSLAIPNITSNVLGVMMYLINSIFAGHLNDPSILAGVGLANTCCMICIITVYMGLNAAQETLTSQAFGSNNMVKVG